MGPADRWARLVTQEYARKFKKLDAKFASEVVGLDSTRVGPIETSQRRFHGGQVIPLVAGWFGEVGKDFETVIQQLTRKAATRDKGMMISPLANMDKK